MIGISKLYCGQVEPSDALRYGRHSSQLPSHLLQFSEDKKPVVVWNMTRRCNLKCVHCYAQAVDPDGKDEISTEQGKAIISDLAAYGAPVMLFSGGEPLVRQDLPELASYATEKGMRAVISTNGTLITKEKARELKAINLSYVGISLDGAEEIHDKFRGVPNSFKKALEGLENCKAEGLKVGLRFTINKRNVIEIPKVFKLLRELEVPRICFYHLVYSGRGSEMIKEDLNHAETRSVVDLIMDETRALFDAGMPKEVLTVDNHADGPYVWMRMLKEDPKRAEEVFQLLQYNEGTRLKGLPLRLHSDGIIGEKLCLKGHYHRQGQGKQQHQQHRGDGGALVQIRMASHGNSSSFVPRLRACPFTVCARRAENEAGMDKQPFPWYTGF